MDRQLHRVRKAYDLTVEQYKKGINSSKIFQKKSRIHTVTNP